MSRSVYYSRFYQKQTTHTHTHTHKTCNKKKQRKKKKPFQFYADSFIIFYTIFQHLTPYTYFGLVISGFVTNLSLPFSASSSFLMYVQWLKEERTKRKKGKKIQEICNLKKMKRLRHNAIIYSYSRYWMK